MMSCDSCQNVFHYFARLARKFFCSRSREKEIHKELPTEECKSEADDGTTRNANKSSVANVAAYGDVRIQLPKHPALTPDVLGSEVEDFDSWNEEMEVLEMQSLTKGDCSQYTTAELDEAIFEDNPDREDITGMSRQSEKDVDSMVEFFENSLPTNKAEKYLDFTGETEKEEVSSELNLTEVEIKGRENLSLQASSVSELQPEGDHLQQSCHAKMRMVMNNSEPSSITTATVANNGSSELELFDESIDRSVCQIQETHMLHVEENSNIPDNSHESVAKSLTFVSSEETQAKIFLCEEEAEEEDEQCTESQCTQTDGGGRVKKRLQAKRRQGILTRRLALAMQSGELTTGRRATGRRRSAPVGVSLLTLLPAACCRGLRPLSVMAAPATRQKRRRPSLQLEAAAVGDLVKDRQWPAGSAGLINSALCGSLRLVEQQKMSPRYENKSHSTIAIPFVFGIESTNVAPTKAGLSETTVTKEDTSTSENIESSKPTRLSPKMTNEGNEADQK